MADKTVTELLRCDDCAPEFGCWGDDHARCRKRSLEDVSVAGRCVFCGGHCSPGDCAVVFTPITDCEHKDPIDGCCRNPKNTTPECHVAACPRLHRRIKI